MQHPFLLRQGGRQSHRAHGGRRGESTFFLISPRRASISPSAIQPRLQVGGPGIGGDYGPGRRGHDLDDTSLFGQGLIRRSFALPPGAGVKPGPGLVEPPSGPGHGAGLSSSGRSSASLPSELRLRGALAFEFLNDFLTAKTPGWESERLSFGAYSPCCSRSFLSSSSMCAAWPHRSWPLAGLDCKRLAQLLLSQLHNCKRSHSAFLSLASGLAGAPLGRYDTRPRTQNDSNNMRDIEAPVLSED